MNLKNLFIYFVLSIFFLYLNLTPFVRDFSGVVSFFTNPLSFFYTQIYLKTKQNYIFFNNVTQTQLQNKQLKEQVTKLKGQLSFYKNLYEEDVFVDRQRDYYGTDKIIYADIIGRDFNGNYNFITINKGLSHNVSKKDNLAYNGYAVGYIKTATPFKAIAVSIDSPNLKIPAISLNSNTSGLFNCSKTGCFIKNVLQDKPLKEGDIFVTSGIAGIFKKGLVLGTVKSVQSDAKEIFKTALIYSELDINNLDKVVIIKYE